MNSLPHAISLLAAPSVSAKIAPVSTMQASENLKLDRTALEKVAEVFRAFSEPTRLQILQELKSGPRNVSDLVAALQVSQANVSKQLKVLHAADIIKRQRHGTQAFYAITDPLTFELCRLVCDKLNRDAKQIQPTFTL